MDELILGVAKLHGPARSLDLAILAENHRQLMQQTEKLLARVGGENPGVFPL